MSRRRGEIFIAEYLPHLNPCRGAQDLLVRLKAHGLKMAVASSAKENELGPLLKICGADKMIPGATSSDDAEESKPNSDILHASLKKIGLSATEVVMLGDTPFDVEAARKAGARVIALRCGGWTDSALHADAVYDDPADLAAHLETSPLAR